MKYSKEQLEEMRKRLYDRGTEAQEAVRHQLSDTKIDVSRDWGQVKPTEGKKKTKTNDLRSDMPVSTAVEAPAETKPKRRYRSFILLGSFLLFVVVAIVSGLHAYLGGNQISGDNIQVSLQGQPLIGGGEVMPLQVAVANQNTVPIESATLILKYPDGTMSVEDNPRNLPEERISLGAIEPGQVQNIPVKIAVFGEESAEKQIQATIEYRVSGSNGMFNKEAAPFTFHISSSPLVLRIDNVEKVASGQLVDVTVTAVSNASRPLKNVLITASYPNGFDYESSDPAPIYGENVWKIEELLPEETATFTLRGVVTGLTEEALHINFSAGPASPDNQYLVAAALADGQADFIIEHPFIDVAVNVNGNSDGSIVLPEGKVANVSIDITNTLDETVYDMIVEVVPGGNALAEDSIKSSGGFYDSNTGTVRWERANNPSFERVLPGAKQSLYFAVQQGEQHTTAAFDLVVNVYAKRVSESNAEETLIGTGHTEAKYSSSITIASQAGRNTAQYVDSGPVPPQVGETTTYTITVVAEAGANDAVNAIVDTSLPVYVNWLNQYDADAGTVTYNPVSKELQWEVGEIPLKQRKELTFQVSLKPSISQVGTIPVLLNSQNMRANDRFTNALLQDKAQAVTTRLSAEMGYQGNSGTVVK